MTATPKMEIIGQTLISTGVSQSDWFALIRRCQTGLESCLARNMDFNRMLTLNVWTEVACEEADHGSWLRYSSYMTALSFAWMVPQAYSPQSSSTKCLFTLTRAFTCRPRSRRHPSRGAEPRRASVETLAAMAPPHTALASPPSS